MLSGSFGQKAEHRSQTLFVVGALLGVTQTTDTSQAGTVDRFSPQVGNIKDTEVKTG